MNHAGVSATNGDAAWETMMVATTKVYLASELRLEAARCEIEARETADPEQRLLLFKMARECRELATLLRGQTMH